MIAQAFLLMGAIWIAGCSTGARSAGTTRATPVADSKSEAVRVNGYALLYQLLEQERNIDKLLLIKLESDELEEIVESIADASADAAARLEEFAKEDPRIDLQRTSLPPGEVAVREAISATKREALLEPFNPEFDVELLRTQTQALSYGWHLAEVIAGHEPDAKRKAWLEILGAKMKRLHDQALHLIRDRLKT